MGITISDVERGWDGHTNKRVVVDVTFDDSYSNGGEDVSASQLGLDRIDFAYLESAVIGDGSAIARYDPSSDVIQAYDNSLSELADTSSALNTDTIRLIAHGG